MMNRNVMQRQMFKGGGYVHPQRMNLGGQPMMDPAGPPMAPPQMGPEQALAGAEAQGQEMGMLAAEGVMQNIDGAQDYQSLIDGIRGNQQPLEARYAELGSIVGEQDARQTPESVLALTQPAIMMTEEGAVNSGIGELMQGIAGDTSMEGQMGEGVGGLMMAQADESMMEVGNTPPVNFRQGGPVEVRGYFDGTEVKADGGNTLTAIPQPLTVQQPAAEVPLELKPYLKRATAARQGILGTPAERAAQLERARNQAQSDAMFNLARFGLAFAGETEGGSIAERLANAASRSQVLEGVQQAGKDAEAQRSLQEQQDVQMRMDALSSAEKSMDTAEGRRGQILLANVNATNQLASQLQNLSFTAAEGQSDRDLRLSIADKQIEAQKALQTVSGTQSIAEINARGKLQKDLADSQQKFRVLLQDDEFEFRLIEAGMGQTRALALEDRRAENVKKLEALRFDNTKEADKLKQGYAAENYRIQAELELDNRLEVMGFQHSFDTAKINLQAGNSRILVRLQDQLAGVAREDKQVHDAQQAALTRTYAGIEKRKDREAAFNLSAFEQDFRLELKEMDIDQAQIDREVARTRASIEDAFANHRLLQGDEQITIAEMQAALDERYKMGMLGVKERAESLVKVGSDAKTSQLSYLTNPDNLKAYANGTLENPALYEQVVLDYIKPEMVWNQELGEYTQGASPGLADQIEKAIEAGNPDFLKRVTKGEPKETVYYNEEATTTSAPFLREARKEILYSDGTTALDSPVWKTTRTAYFDPTVKYGQAIGFSRVFPAFKKGITEGFAEATGKKGTDDPEVKNLTKAAKTLDNFATELLRFSTNIGSDDRVLKFVQVFINDNVKDIRPGGFFLKTDADALATLNALSQQLSLGIQKNAARLPEYGGTATGMKKTAIQDANARQEDMKIMLNEVLAFKRQFEAADQAAGVAGPITDNSVRATQNFLEGLGG